MALRPRSSARRLPSEIETLADIAFRRVGARPDAVPQRTGGEHAEAERKRLSAAVHELLDRIIVAEIDGVAGGLVRAGARPGLHPVSSS